jgi:hypothetical protein
MYRERFANELIKAGEYNIAVGGEKTRFTHRQLLTTIGVTSLTAALGTVLLGDHSVNQVVPAVETTAKLLKDHTEVIKNKCLLFTDLVRNGEPGFKGGLVGFENTEYQQIGTVAKRILHQGALSVKEQCVIQLGGEVEMGKVIVTTASEKANAQLILNTLSEKMSPFTNSAVRLFGITSASVVQTLWMGFKHKLDDKVVTCSSRVLMGKAMVGLGNYIKGS